MKTKIGISAGLLGAALYLTGLFSGYTVLTLLAGYVLLCEEDEWLRRTAVRAYVICIGFSLLSALIGFIPNAISLLDSVFHIFSSSIYGSALSGLVNAVSGLVSLIQEVLSILEKIVLLLLAVSALNMNNTKLGFIDDLIDKHCSGCGTVCAKAAAKPSAKPDVKPAAPATKFCTNCGARLDADAAFCPHCGNKG